MHLRFGAYKRVPLALLAAALTATAAGAATLHRFSVSQPTGSEGALTFLQGSPTGSALQGQVNDSAANTKVKIPFGVLGEYNPSGTTFGIGVAGISTTGYGVGGESLGSAPGVFGFGNSAGYGVEGATPSSSNSAAIAGFASGGGDGIDASATTGYGASFDSANAAGLVAASDLSAGGVGLVGEPVGTGVEADGYSGTSAFPALTALDQVGSSDLIGAYGCAPNGNGCTNPESFIVQSGTANRSGNGAYYAGAADVQLSGDLYVYGRVYENCDNFPAGSDTRCYDTQAGAYNGSDVVTRSAGGTDVKVYTPKESVSTVEDFGQAQLVNGRAYVNLDRAFARTTAPGAPYLVFVTPEGDSRGVFTTNHTPAGFEVHENGGGRSSMVFDYRIVAKPLGDTSQRFVAVAPKHHIPGYNVRKRIAGQDPKAMFRRLHRPAPIPPLALAH